MATPPLQFPRRAHLRRSAEFQVVFTLGKRLSGACFRLHAHLTDDGVEARLGVAVSKRVDKSAVGRNRLRRQAKEAFRLERDRLHAGDYVFVAKPDAAKADNREVRSELLSLLVRARTLKPVAAPGTMPPSVASPDRKPTDV